MTHANLIGADLSNADMANAILEEANISSANLTYTILNNANLKNARLNYTLLDFSSLNNSDLSNTILDNAKFSNANLINTDFTNAYVSFAMFRDVDLHRSTGLTTIIHGGPSSVGIDTLYRSEGAIPDDFLHGCGVPDEMIAFAHSLAGAIQYYSVFISYSSKDYVFAQRLYNDLQGAQVRCWFAPRSLKGGDMFWSVIDQSIIQYDKVIVVLSEDAIRSDPVSHEVEQAINKEHQLKRQGLSRTVLFPLKIDKSIEATTISWAADIQRTRHIGDFTLWRDFIDYREQFQKLLQDLKSKSSFK